MMSAASKELNSAKAQILVTIEKRVLTRAPLRLFRCLSTEPAINAKVKTITTKLTPKRAKEIRSPPKTLLQFQVGA